MNFAQFVVDRLAALDEAGGLAGPPVEEPPVEAPPVEAPPVEAPPVEPDIDPNNPWAVPPDLAPEELPGTKAEDEDQAIESWLTATEQPARDWEWDGQRLRLLLNDGSTEVYSREQLEEIGVFGAEIEEPPVEPPTPPVRIKPPGVAPDPDDPNPAPTPDWNPGVSLDREFPNPWSPDEPGISPYAKLYSESEDDDDEDDGHEKHEPDDTAETGDFAEPEPVPDDVAGILGDAGGEIEVISGEPEERLATAVGDVVQAILGIVQQAKGGESGPPEGELPVPAEEEEAAEEGFGAGFAAGEIADEAPEGPEQVEERKLSAQARRQLPRGSFVYPGERRYPIEDKSHARNALARVAQHGSPAEKARVRGAVHSKYPDIGEK